jgi:hypothetical protein
LTICDFGFAIEFQIHHQSLERFQKFCGHQAVSSERIARQRRGLRQPSAALPLFHRKMGDAKRQRRSKPPKPDKAKTPGSGMGMAFMAN